MKNEKIIVSARKLSEGNLVEWKRIGKLITSYKHQNQFIQEDTKYKNKIK